MTESQKVLSDIVTFAKYSRHREDLNRRENWTEIVDRVEKMHLDRYGLSALTMRNGSNVFDKVRQKLVMPSMRSLQFAGKAIESNESRIFNCAFTNIDSKEAFREIFFLLLGGTGVGYSVQWRHVSVLPVIFRTGGQIDYEIPDDIEGWARALDAEMNWHFGNGPQPYFIYNKIRPKGATLKTAGGVAPGPEPLQKTLERVREVCLSIPNGGKLFPLHVHDIICHIADSVISGGIRRSACISLFDAEDDSMLQCKSGQVTDKSSGFEMKKFLIDEMQLVDSGMLRCLIEDEWHVGQRFFGDVDIWNEFSYGKRTFVWWEIFPWRARSNNSAVLLRHATDKKVFDKVMQACYESKAGEPGIFWTNDLDWGTNPCAEIALQSKQFCNLTTLNASQFTGNMLHDSELVEAETIIGTLQAGYTDFPDILKDWKAVTKEESLLGCSLTGVAAMPAKTWDYLHILADNAKWDNWETAKKIGINQAARITTIKPEGTSSVVLGTASGVHGYWAKHYLRRVQLNKEEPIYKYLKAVIPNCVEDLREKSDTTAVVALPIEAPDGAIMRSESGIDTLIRIGALNRKWIVPAHISGANTHNVSATVNYRDSEWQTICQWSWDNREVYSAVSFLPYDDTVYQQAPHEEISEKVYKEWLSKVNPIDLREVIENEDITNLEAEQACAGGRCEI